MRHNPTGYCGCRGQYDTCVQNLGCPQSTVNAVVAACEESGCSQSDCQPSVAVDFATILSQQVAVAQTCDAPTLQSCGSSLTSCVEQHDTDPSAICNCRGAYDQCIQNAGCPAATVNAVVAACQEAGCTAAQCSATVSAPMTCDAPTLQACGSALTSCVEQNYSSPSAICNCRGTYDQCIQNAGCPAATVNAVVAACEEAGCTASQCAA
jgi:hypothetical protein